jgi:hypothetical protein
MGSGTATPIFLYVRIVCLCFLVCVVMVSVRFSANGHLHPSNIPLILLFATIVPIYVLSMFPSVILPLFAISGVLICYGSLRRKRTIVVAGIVLGAVIWCALVYYSIAHLDRFD